jgi:hypothetical protein
MVQHHNQMYIMAWVKEWKNVHGKDSTYLLIETLVTGGLRRICARAGFKFQKVVVKERVCYICNSTIYDP